MVRDAVTNVVMRLMNCGYDPRKVGDDAWESRCPAHRSTDHCARDHSQCVQPCHSRVPERQNCAHSRIVSALGLTNEHLYAETPEGWVRRLALVPVQTASRSVTAPSREQDGGPSAAAMAGTSAANQTVLSGERRTSTDGGVASTAGPTIAEIHPHEVITQQDVTARVAEIRPLTPSVSPSG